MNDPFSTLQALPKNTIRDTIPGTILVDASNIAHMESRREGRPSARILRLVLDDLEARGYDPIAIADASLEHKFAHDDVAALAAPFDAGRLRVAPCATSADVWLLEFAEHLDCPIVSNDTFSDHMVGSLRGDEVQPSTIQHAWLLDPGRLVTCMTLRDHVSYFARPLRLAQLQAWRPREVARVAACRTVAADARASPASSTA